MSSDHLSRRLKRKLNSAVLPSGGHRHRSADHQIEGIPYHSEYYKFYHLKVFPYKNQVYWAIQYLIVLITMEYYKRISHSPPHYIMVSSIGHHPQSDHRR